MRASGQRALPFCLFLSQMLLLPLCACLDYFIKAEEGEEVGEWWIDEFLQGSQSMMDILWVIDNSGSMIEEQEGLSSSMESFVQPLTDLEIMYQIGIITTDTDSGQGGILQGIPPIVTPQMEDPASSASENALVGTEGSSVERGLLAMQLALSPPLIENENRGFLRKGATLAVIVFSDDNDNSEGDVHEYTDFLDSLKGEGNEGLSALYAITGERETGCEGENGRASGGDRYIDAAEMSGGKFYSICTTDFSPLLEDIAGDALIFEDEFPLSLEPLDGTLSVLVNGERMEEGEVWFYRDEGNMVVFEEGYVPGVGARIKLIYMVKDAL